MKKSLVLAAPVVAGVLDRATPIIAAVSHQEMRGERPGGGGEDRPMTASMTPKAALG